MSSSLRLILFNADEAYARELRAALLAVPQVKIVAELDEASLLPQAVAQFPCDGVVAHLDPGVMVALEVAAQLAQANPKLPVFAISECTQGDVLLRAMRAGLKRFLVKPLQATELSEALALLAAEQPSGKEPGRLISVMASAGGVGATFVATNLAVELAELVGESGRVALLDFDFRFGQVATVLDLEPQFTVADLCGTPEQLDPAMIDKGLVRHGSGVHVLARPHHFHQAESITAAHCASVMSMLQEMFSYVVIDGPTRNDPGARTVLDTADYNLMVLQLLVTSVRNADRMLQELVSQGFNTSRVQMICNRVGRESGHLQVEQVEKTLSSKMFHLLPDDWKTVSTAINLGQPVSQEFGRTRIRQALRELAMKIHTPAGLTREERAGGLLGRLIKSVSRGDRGAGAKPTAGALAAAGG